MHIPDAIIAGIMYGLFFWGVWMGLLTYFGKPRLMVPEWSVAVMWLAFIQAVTVPIVYFSVG